MNKVQTHAELKMIYLENIRNHSFTDNAQASKHVALLSGPVIFASDFMVASKQDILSYVIPEE